MKYRVVEIYKRGEKKYIGKAHRLGWRVYVEERPGRWVFQTDLEEKKGLI